MINELLEKTIEKNASDLHLVPHYYPSIRINNELFYLNDFGIIEPDKCSQMILSLLSENQKVDLLANKEIDLSYAHGDSRFRVNIYTVKGELAAAFRLIPSVIRTIEDLYLPNSFHKLTTYRQGLVLLTGPTGEGKSTTLASLVNEINLKQSKHILTVEDPIEFVYGPGRSIISQRELHQDTFSFANSLRSALREDPDIVLIGEMRDYDTIQAALTIAETGHLVLSTLHTKSTPETVDRIVDVFPEHQQNQVRSQLAGVLIAIVAQRLLPTTTGKPPRIPAIELMWNNSATAALIRESKSFMLDNVIATSADQGMILFEKDLQRLYERGMITKETALSYALRPNSINKFIF